MKAGQTLAVMCAVFLVGIIALAACGGPHGGSGGHALATGSGGFPTADSVGGLEIYQPEGLAAPPAEMPIAEALAELDALACPNGVDSALWEELKATLAEGLSYNRGRDARATKITATPPTGDINRVNDLGMADNGDGSYTLTWHYRNLGDYGQDGKVGISDITPIAVHFGETYDPETEPNSLQAVIDGSGNEKVDIADVTPIAQNYGIECAVYSIRRSSSYPEEVDDTTELDTAPVEPEQWEERRVFSRDFALPPYTYIAVAPIDAEGTPGELSNVRYTTNHPPVAALIADPTEGDAPLTVNLDASGSHDPDGPMAKYEWDWEGDGVWDEDTGAAHTVQHVYELADYYYPVVRVTDSSGATATAEAEVWAGRWRIVAVDSAGATFNSLAIIDGHPAIAFWQNALMYVRATDPLGSAWGEPVRVDSQGSCFSNSLAVVNGRPAIAYYGTQGLDYKLKYVRADDASGDSWGGPLVLAEAGGSSTEVSGLSLVVIDGNPAIAYEGRDWYFVSYIRALDVDGDSWGSAKGLAHMFSSPSNCVMTEANGRPAICYWDEYGQYLRWIRADDAAGGAWGAPVTVDDFPGNSTMRISLAIINGYPAISYGSEEDDTDGLVYRRALDSGGAAWGPPLRVDSWPEHGGWPTLVTVNGRPAITYVELLEERYTLMYITAADADGTSWRSPVVVEGPPLGEGGPTYSSMAEVSGHPAISYAYMDPAHGIYQIRYAIYY